MTNTNQTLKAQADRMAVQIAQLRREFAANEVAFRRAAEIYDEAILRCYRDNVRRNFGTGRGK